MTEPDTIAVKPGCKFPFRRRRAICIQCAAEPFRMYEWDSPAQSWSGPNELGYCSGTNARLLKALSETPGSSWLGSISSRAAGEDRARFFTLVHDSGRCGLALLYCNDTKSGPVEIVAVVPADRRSELGDEFAFEFLGFARFLNVIGPEAELTLHEALTAAIADHSDCRALVFSISSGLWPSDLAPSLSHCVEQVALTLATWLERSCGDAVTDPDTAVD